MTLSDRAIKFINQHSDDIDNNRFDNLYSALVYEDDEEKIGTLRKEGVLVFTLKKENF
jgi:hypothetical protein